MKKKMVVKKFVSKKIWSKNLESREKKKSAPERKGFGLKITLTMQFYTENNITFASQIERI